MKLGDLSITYVELMARAAQTAGFDASHVMNQYELPAERWALPGHRVSIPRFLRVGHEVIRQGGIADLGLRMGALTSPSVLGLAGWLADSADTVRGACEALVRYELLASFNARGRSSFIVEAGKGKLCFYSISPYNAYNRFIVDMVLKGWASLLMHISGEDLVERVTIEFEAPAWQERYGHHFSCPVQFGAEQNAIVLKSGALEKLLLHRCASHHRWLLDMAEAELAKVKRGLSVSEQVARALSPMLEGCAPELAEVSRQFGKAPWTLKRMLAAENTNYQTVLDNTRRDLAIAYVRETDLAVGEIAYLTGFGSATAFQRAFKRWTGETPRQLRQSSV